MPPAGGARHLADVVTVDEAKAIAARFTSPPINEVSLAVGFQPVPLGVITAGALWRAEFETGYPTVEEQSQVKMPIEAFGGIPSVASTLQWEINQGPLLPRLWFVSKDGSELVQVQHDWFARNWRQTETSTSPYPLYPVAREAFERDLRKFEAFVGPIRPLQAEITYINHIDGADMAEVIARLDPGNAVPEFEGYSRQYVLTRDGGPVGRLYIQAQKALRRSSGEPLTVLTITVRGAPIGQGIEGVLRLLDIGNEEALVAFIDSTRPAMHERWAK